MKKIVIALPKMIVGGLEKALVTMLNEIDYSRYEITLFLLFPGGDFEKLIPNNVKKIYINLNEDLRYALSSPFITAITYLIRIRNFKIIFEYIFYKIIYKLNPILGTRFLLKGIEKNQEKYDLAISYDGLSFTINEYILTKINSKKKVRWIHADIDSYEYATYAYMNKRFSKTFLVSEELMDKMLKKGVNKSEIDVFQNIISSKLINNAASYDESFQDQDFEGTRVLTIGRLCSDKGQDMSIEVLQKLIQDGYNIRWYLIGTGEWEERLKKQVEDLSLGKYMIFLGVKMNPYPFLKDCDIYVQPSRSEAYCTTIMEAKILSKPIIFTKVNGAKEQITNKKNGILCDANCEDIYKSLKSLIDNKALQSNIIRNLNLEEIDTRNEINKLYSLIEKE